jgi:predicted enzyme related to lactoylglutathione lyase
MKTSGITAALPAQDLGRAKAFYVEKVGLQALESDFLKARDGQVGLTVGDGVSQLFVYPAQARSSGEFTQAVIHVTDVRAAVEEMRGRGVAFEEYDTPETRTENGVARMPGGGEAAWFKDSERQSGRRCSSLGRSAGRSPGLPSTRRRKLWSRLTSST